VSRALPEAVVKLPVCAPRVSSHLNNLLNSRSAEIQQALPSLHVNAYRQQCMRGRVESD
jgi:hypothetical protein